MTYCNMTENALVNYEENTAQLNFLLNSQMTNEQKISLAQSYDILKSQGKTHEEASAIILSSASDEQAKIATQTFLDYYSKQGADYSESKISEYVLLSIQDSI